MSTAELYREYATECLQHAQAAPTPDDKNIHLNLALAWVRLAQQSEHLRPAETTAPALAGAE